MGSLLDPFEWRPFSEEGMDTLTFEKMQPISVAEGEEEAKLGASGDDYFHFPEDTDFRDASSTDLSNASTDTQLKQEFETLKKDHERLHKDLEDMKKFQEKSESANKDLKMEIEKINKVMAAAMQRFNIFLAEEENLKDSIRRLTNTYFYYERLLKENGIDPLEHMDKYPQNH